MLGRFGSATPKVRHSEVPALLCNLLSLGSKLTAQINGTYLTLSLTLTITLTLLILTVTVRVTLQNGGPSEWRTVTAGEGLWRLSPDHNPSTLRTSFGS